MSLRFVGLGPEGSGEGPAKAAVGWREAIDGGTAPDGSLWVPVEVPSTFGERWGATQRASFGVWAAERARDWLDSDVGGADLEGALDLPVRLRSLGAGIDLLDLTRGPTGAFKDVGARFLAALWSVAAVSGHRSRTVLTATSGDTGGAVAAAVDGVESLRAVILFPLDRVSDVQRRQFTTRQPKVRAVGVRGTFDDCQTLARRAFDDPGLVEACGLVSANSINPGRLLPQALYHAWAVADGDPRPVVVPSGNLGNVTAAVLSRSMGASLGEIHAVVNENDALVRAAAGNPPRSGTAVRTDSSAMDVGRPSNLSRLRWLAAREGVDLSELVHPISVPTERAREAQRWAMEAFGVMVDPHTATGVARARDLVGEQPGVRPLVIETAHPAKFPDVVRKVLGRDAPDATWLHRAGEEAWTEIDADAEALTDVLEEGATR